ncbi:beta-ketoacyl synthase N-terminal-like domain-containing protein [Pseudomaricurvus sp. HS19]|uniref:beta-ketoacyl synthase N-terminal-like domain-containing protein n=1 Tax=Pseudomaricurvus sp. HS19 TaxID=2692626 RepID=UPI001367BF3D|nr:beta-ketoacyl synthase N-terminal-like domain-containing protein [Pseudomaricurvus sp. HS19]MYM63964.1 hypothetical protein [Pseudomaricurvus sp. HS19]
MYKLDIIACGDYAANVAENETPADLRADVNAVCRERPRRIDRYTQLALLGSARCVGEQPLSPRTGLYMGSRFASLSNAITMHEQMIGRGDTPKPAHFINSLSNSASFYVARNLELSGRNQFVSRGDASTVATLQVASLDLLSGTVDEALVGIVEEAVTPLAHHRQRLAVSTDSNTQGEGSHWLRLARSGSGATALGQVDQLRCLADSDALQQWLQAMQSEQEGTLLFAAPTCRAAVADLWQGGWFDPSLAYYPAISAGALLAFVQSPPYGVRALLCVTGDEDGRWHVVRVSCG